MPHEHELALDDGDLGGILGLPGQLGQRSAALRANPIGLWQRVHGFDERERGLGFRSVPTLGRRRYESRLGPRSLLGGIAEQDALALREQLLEEFEVNLSGSGVLAAEGRQLGGQLLEAIVEALILAFEERRDLTKHVSIVDLFDTQHTGTTSSLRA
jgi:hypothetical protein